jgi:hemerythrin-like domain-containing protein
MRIKCCATVRCEAADIEDPNAATMNASALAVIREEHAALAAMLRSLPMLLDQTRRRGESPDFGLLRAMLFYIDEFPERLHHKKEDEMLFPVVRKRCPELAATLDQLDRDHAHGERAIRELEHALLAFEVLGEPRREAFERAAQGYVDFYLRHMALEESDVLPAAQRALDSADWAAIDAAFAANRDPLTGHEPADEYRPLFSRIVNRAPAPVGLG